jgi:hypothetical protein
MNNEPVAWLWTKDGKPQSALLHEPMTVPSDPYWKDKGFKATPLYTHPAKTLTEDTECQYCKQGCIRCDARKLLTDDEITEVIKKIASNNEYVYSLYEDFEGIEFSRVGIFEFARAILKKASEK